ncbi:MAG: ferredoxin [Eubacteriales bacterium]|nr:ferredoxin [Eubacteriales bacterium]
MKATIDRTGCIGCGLCPDICPEVFQMADDGLAEVIAAEIPTDAEGNAQEAAESCPVSVIVVE